MLISWLMEEDCPVDPAVVRRFNQFGPQIQDRIVKSLVRITWMVAQKHPKGKTIADSKPGVRFGTGFLVFFRNRTFVATAGHVIENLAKDNEEPTRVVRISIDWSPSTDRFVSALIPHQFARLHYRCGDKTGVDVGVIEIPESPAKQLAAERASWIDAAAYRPPEFTPNLFVAAGYPRTGREDPYTVYEDRVSFEVRQPCPLLPIAPLPDQFIAEDRPQRFRGRLLSRHAQLDGKTIFFDTTNGMSGGPIYALELQEKGWQQGLIAIQTHEREGRGTISGTFFRQFWEFLEANF